MAVTCVFLSFCLEEELIFFPPVFYAIRQWDGKSAVAWKPFRHDSTIRLCISDCLCPLLIGIEKQQEAAKVQGQVIACQFLHRQGPGRQPPRHSDLCPWGQKHRCCPKRISEGRGFLTPSSSQMVFLNSTF